MINDNNTTNQLVMNKDIPINLSQYAVCAAQYA